MNISDELLKCVEFNIADSTGDIISIYTDNSFIKIEGDSNVILISPEQIEQVIEALQVLKTQLNYE
jgi:hypothetical protein